MSLANYRYLPLYFFVTCCLHCLSANSQTDTARLQKEEDFYRIYTVPVPRNVELEVGGMTLLPSGALAACTRHGEVWVINNPYAKNGTAPTYHLFAQGLHEALGLNYVKNELYVTQRSELTRLRDLDGDGEADEYKTICQWPLSGNYHEYAYGPIMDKQGNFYVTLNLGWTTHGISLSKWHGWMLKIDSTGKYTPFAVGFRSPAGFNFNTSGDIFYAENQGDWVGSGYIAHVEQGNFMGNPEGLRWTDEPNSPIKLKASDIPDTDEPKYEVAKRVPQLKTPAVWFPHTILGISTSGILPQDSSGNMGPYAGQLFVGDQGQSKIMRVDLEKVKGRYQGVVFPFREGFMSGIVRLIWGADGSMFVGMTSRGWGSTGPALYGLQRLEWTGKTPFEMKTVKAKPDGFEIEFTQPVDEKRARDASSYELTSFTYKYGHHYGSPVINQGACPLRAISVSPDKLKVRLVVDSMRLGYIHEIRAAGVRSADNVALLHNYGYYTLNELPDGDKLPITAENKVAAASVHDNMKMDNKAAVKPASVKSSKHQTRQPSDWTKGPDQTIQLNPVPGLKFNTSLLTVRAGTHVKLTFTNSDDMLHNVVIVTPGAADTVGGMALKLGLNGERLSYIPSTPKVLYHTLLLQPGKAESIYFTAPEKAGDYPYICTYPGHYLVMRGILKVVAK